MLNCDYRARRGAPCGPPALVCGCPTAHVRPLRGWPVQPTPIGISRSRHLRRESFAARVAIQLWQAKLAPVPSAGMRLGAARPATQPYLAVTSSARFARTQSDLLPTRRWPSRRWVASRLHRGVPTASDLLSRGRRALPHGVGLSPLAPLRHLPGGVRRHAWKANLWMRTQSALSGQNLGLRKSFLRYLASICSAVALYVGYLYVRWDRRKRTWHDIVAESVVIMKRGD